MTFLDRKCHLTAFLALIFPACTLLRMSHDVFYTPVKPPVKPLEHIIVLNSLTIPTVGRQKHCRMSLIKRFNIYC